MGKEASLLEVKKYFGESNSKKFAAEWRELSADEKRWFKMEVYRVTH